MNKKIAVWLMVATFVLVLLPVIDTIVTTGSAWKGVPTLYTDEVLYYAQVREVSEGYIFFGNPYFYEHREDLTPAFFGSNWLASVPFLLGFNVPSAIMFDFLIWSLIFVFLTFYFLHRLGAGNTWSALGALFVFIQSYLTAYRMSVRQEVFPFFILFFIALFVWIQNPRDKKRIAFLAISAGTSFYLYSFFWQVVVATLGLILVYSIFVWLAECREGRVKKFVLSLDLPRLHFSSVIVVNVIAAMIALPIIYYSWLQVHTPFYWEGMARFGLINTHIPTAEVVYSGSWVFLSIALFILGRRWLGKMPNKVLAFFVLTGIAMVCLQASNVITGKELETAQHVKSFIVPWLAISFFTWLGYNEKPLVVYVRKSWRRLSVAVLIILVVALACANIHFILFIQAFPGGEPQALRKDMQEYAAPLSWLEEQESEPVVIWAPPAHLITPYIPVLTKHYVLYTEPGNLNILSDREVEERYLVSKYLEGISTTTLKEEFALYAGRSRTYHYPKTLERKQKICRILGVEESWQWCPKEIDTFVLVGDAYFDRLIAIYKNDILPHIRQKLADYHVRYILNDKKFNAEVDPKRLTGTHEVYDDGRFEIYRYE